MIAGIVNLVLENLTISLVFAASVLFALRWLNDPNRGKRLPPGPWNIPFVGQLPFIATDFDGFVRKMADKYGDIYRIKIGGREVYMLSSYKAIKEALITKGEIFSGRDRAYSLVNYFLDFRGLLIEDGLLQKEQRRFALSTLRDFGLGRVTMEEKIHRETRRIGKHLKSEEGKLFKIRDLLDNATVNVISAISMDTNFNYDDPDFKSLRDLTLQANDFLETKVVVFLPWLRHLSKEWSGFNLFNQVKERFHALIEKQIRDHKITLDENNPRDYLDCHLAENNKLKTTNPSAPNPFDEGRLVTNLSLFCIAGMLTTSATLNWAFKLLLLYPDSQKDVHEEIDNVIGASRLPCFSDRGQMPKTEAYLCEVQRVADALPLSFPHTNTEEVNLLGYVIPKRSLIFASLRGVHQDPKIWNDPQNFRPSRFINAEGKCDRPEYLIPFSVGKRSCMGENLARMEIFLLFVGLLQQFTFSPPEGVVPKLELQRGVGRALVQYEMCAKSRI